MSDRNLDLPTKDIALVDYTRLITMTRSQAFLDESLAEMDTARLDKGLAWVKDLDPRGAAFRFLEDDGAPMPDDVQKYHGRIYLTSLNRLRKRIEVLLAERTAMAAF